MNLTGIKVKIGLSGGTHDFPNFNTLPVVIASGIDWAYYVDMYGTGWVYDKITGHSDETIESPMGIWFGCLLIPQQFATEAIAAFPLLCTALTEVEYQDFYDNKAMVRLPENLYDETAVASSDREVRNLDEISAADPSDVPKRDAADAARVRRGRALDPADETPGLRKNHKRYWVDHKLKSGITYV